METSWLIERLDNPALLQKGDEQRLRELIASYPYFSAPYLLLARSLHAQKHPAFEQLLPLISLQAFDRKRLFKLIHEETMDHRPWTIAEEETWRLGDLETWRQGDEENEIVRHMSEEPVLSQPKESTTDVPESLDEEMKTEVEKASIPRFAVDFNEVEKTEEEPVQTIHHELHEIPFLMDEVVGAENFLPASAIDEAPEPISDTPNHKSQIINQKYDRIDFLHWLEKLQPVKKGEEVGGRGDLETWRQGDKENEMVRHLSEEPVLSQPKETRGQEPLPAEAPAKEGITQNPESLIDKFIENNPSVSRVKERFYDAAVQARESERLDDNLMTETLARIFVKQEKYERAIDAYRKLQLKYPEKSDYFAALILEINSKIN